MVRITFALPSPPSPPFAAVFEDDDGVDADGGVEAVDGVDIGYCSLSLDIAR